MEKLRLGVSACLLGLRVRYDGQQKLDAFLRDTLGQHVDFVTVCPEVEYGLPVPREPIQLVGDPASPRLVTVHTRRDLTARMQRWIDRRLKELEGEELDGYIFKSRSPSCGVERVKIHDDRGVVRGHGSGLFVAAFRRRFPLLPVEDEDRFSRPAQRESFLERVFVLRRWRELLRRGRRLGGLVEFHTRHKLLILSHSTTHYRALGRLVAEGKALAPRDLFERYQTLLLAGLELAATPAKHCNVLHHLMGYFKKQLTADEKRELLEQIEAYRRGDVPRIVPLTLFAHQVRKHRPPYLLDQVYLNPHPLELRLRNHA
jgi:uncharacterized protein YbgA (DUF1722 family)/uncharacterized protein YbbK (DUF523 family)